MPVEPIPDYVLDVISEFRSVILELVRHSRRPMPGRHSPIVISVVKDEADRLVEFFRHYRSIGVERFAFIDNGSEDNTVAYLSDQPDVDLYRMAAPFNWKRKQGWINRVIEIYGYDRWYVYVDADEHMIYDGYEQVGLSDLTQSMERLGVTRVRGFLLDMYSEGPLLEAGYVSGQRLLDAFGWFDRDSYTEARFKQIISLKGGPRRRVFGRADEKLNPELTKYALFKCRPGEFMANPHHIWPYRGNFGTACFLGLLHFKFLPGLIDKLRRASEIKNYWDDSFECRCYLTVIEAEPDVSFYYDGSERFRSASQLVSLGLLAPLDWAERDGAVDRMHAAFRMRKATAEACASAATGGVTMTGWHELR